MLPPEAERPKLASLLAQLGAAVEELLLSGLTTASEATRQTLAATMQEAARFRLLRLGSTLRAATEELARFTAHDPLFSRMRLTFFLSRAWLLSRGLAHALQSADAKEYDRLTWSPPMQPLPKVKVVCVGVAKKVAARAFVSFEFRFRALADAAPVKAGQRLAWSVVFPLKPGLEIPPEGFLHLPQKQKFTPFILLEAQSSKHRVRQRRQRGIRWPAGADGAEHGGARQGLQRLGTVPRLVAGVGRRAHPQTHARPSRSRHRASRKKSCFAIT